MHFGIVLEIPTMNRNNPSYVIGSGASLNLTNTTKTRRTINAITLVAESVGLNNQLLHLKNDGVGSDMHIMVADIGCSVSRPEHLESLTLERNTFG